nr:IS30 family transposase [Cohaesibacter sp. ES.047]
MCKRTRPVLVIHERKSRVTLAARMTGKSAAETVSVMMSIFRRLDPALRKSVTFDNDTTFAQHSLLRSMFNMTTWFCDAYASWQKGGVENANGRLRRWLPRDFDIDAMDDEELQDIIFTMNLTPRKCLGFKTHSRRCCKTLVKTPKSALLKPVALRDGIHPGVICDEIFILIFMEYLHGEYGGVSHSFAECAREATQVDG